MRPVAAVLCVLSLALAGCAAGDFHLEQGKVHRGNVQLTVGNVEVGPEARVVGAVSLRAGEVEAAGGSEVTGAISVDHGNVTLAEGARAASVRVANGAVRLARGAAVAGAVEVTNGLISVRGATIGEPVSLVRGRLEIGPGSVLSQGLQVRNAGRILQDSTHVVIEEGARVSGPILTEGFVRLIVAPGADVAGASFVGLQPEGW